MPSHDEWHRILGPGLSEKDLADFIVGAQNLIHQFLNEYIQEEFEPDDC